MTGTHEAEVWKYVDEGLDGTRPACIELRQACERFRDDWTSGKWDINPYEADYIIDKVSSFFELYIAALDMNHAAAKLLGGLDTVYPLKLGNNNCSVRLELFYL